jgi:hypothetical protein
MKGVRIIAGAFIALVFAMAFLAGCEGTNSAVNPTMGKSEGLVDIRELFSIEEFAFISGEGVPGPDLDCGLCGDVNGNGKVDIWDPYYLKIYIFYSRDWPICKWAADCNGDGVINVLDIVVLNNYLGHGGPAPTCGQSFNH